jgi:hypothetical protein
MANRTYTVNNVMKPVKIDWLCVDLTSPTDAKAGWE